MESLPRRGKGWMRKIQEKSNGWQKCKPKKKKQSRKWRSLNFDLCFDMCDLLFGLVYTAA